MSLPTLSIDEFLRYAQADRLTDTAIQVEALRRLETMAERGSELEAFAAVIDEYEVTASELRSLIESHPASIGEQAQLLAALNDQDIDSPDELKAVLGAVAAFRALANDAGDIFTRAASLIETAQKED